MEIVVLAQRVSCAVVGDYRQSVRNVSDAETLREN